MRKISLIAFSLALAACGGGGGGGGSATNNPAPDPAYTIQAFSVDPSIIDPAINGGQFELTWTVKDASKSNYVRMYFSSNETISNADAEIFNQLCVPNIGCGVNTYAADCTFDNSNVMACSGLGSEDLTANLPGLPMNGYLILQACSDPLSNCDTAFIPITLQ